MAIFTSKYTGPEIESLLDKVNNNDIITVDNRLSSTLYNRVDDGVHDVELYYDDNNGNYQDLKNHHICRGCSNRMIEIYQNRDCETTYTMTSDGELREFVLGDVV